MIEGTGLPDGELTVRLTGVRSSVGRAGVKIDLELPAAAIAQLLDTGATGAVGGTNLRVELRAVDLGYVAAASRTGGGVCTAKRLPPEPFAA